MSERTSQPDGNGTGTPTVSGGDKWTVSTEDRSARSVLPDGTRHVTETVLSSIYHPIDSKNPVIVKCGILFVIGVFNLIGNSIVLAVFKRTPRLRTKAFTLLFSLTVADLVSGLDIFFYIPYQLVTYVFGSSPCDSVMMIAVLTGPVRYPMMLTVSHICFISVERFIAISFPLHYESWVTDTTMKIVISVIWILPGIMSATFFLFISRINWTTCAIRGAVLQLSVSDVTYILFAFTVTLVLYSRIMMIALHQRAKINAEVSCSPTSFYICERNRKFIRLNFSDLFFFRTKRLKTLHKCCHGSTIVIGVIQGFVPKSVDLTCYGEQLEL
jgi:hypothetical protein